MGGLCAQNQPTDPPGKTKSYNCLWPSPLPQDYPFITSELILIFTWTKILRRKREEDCSILLEMAKWMLLSCLTTYLLGIQVRVGLVCLTFWSNTLQKPALVCWKVLTLDLNLFCLQLLITLVLRSEMRHLTLGFLGCWNLKVKILFRSIWVLTPLPQTQWRCDLSDKRIHFWNQELVVFNKRHILGLMNLELNLLLMCVRLYPGVPSFH